MGDSDLEAEIERRLGELGYELVEMEYAGARQKPIYRLRIDRITGGEESITVEDCTRASRALEPFLDERPGVAPGYVLEVSSPGVERPLVRTRDFERFVDKEIALQGKEPLAGRARRLEGVLLGLSQDGSSIRLRLADGEELDVPRTEVSRANLVFRWGGGSRPKKGGGPKSFSDKPRAS